MHTGSPQAFINSHGLKSMKTAIAASVVREGRSSSRSWGGLRKSPPVQADAVLVSGKFVHSELPTGSFAVWVYVVPPEVMPHAVLLGRDSWMRWNDRF